MEARAGNAGTHDSHPSDTLSTIVPFVFYQDISAKDVQFLEKTFEMLRENHIGHQLLNQIGLRLKSSRSLIITKVPEHKESKEGHAFQPPSEEGGDLVIYINFKKTEGSRIGTIGNRVSFGGKFYYEIGSMVSPFHITLGHELIHCLHYLEEPALFSKKMRITTTSDLFSDRIGRVPNRDIWGKEEEQETVIGMIGSIPIGKQITESALLMAEGFPPRYAYHPPDRFFYEDAEIIDHIFPFPEILGEAKKPGWKFNPDSAKRDVYCAQGFPLEKAEDLVQDFGTPVGTPVRSKPVLSSSRKVSPSKK